jgi:chromosome segregation ATPase
LVLQEKAAHIAFAESVASQAQSTIALKEDLESSRQLNQQLSRRIQTLQEELAAAAASSSSASSVLGWLGGGRRSAEKESTAVVRSTQSRVPLVAHTPICSLGSFCRSNSRR